MTSSRILRDTFEPLGVMFLPLTDTKPSIPKGFSNISILLVLSSRVVSSRAVLMCARTQKAEYSRETGRLL